MRGFGVVVLGFCVPLLFAQAVAAQGRCDANDPYYWEGIPGDSPANINCQGFDGFRCYEPRRPGREYFRVKSTSCDPKAGECTVQMRVPLEFPGLEQMIADHGLSLSPTPTIFWFTSSPAPPCPGTECGQDTICGTSGFGGKLNRDLLETWVERSVSCASAPMQTEVFSLRAIVCRTASAL
jgi:hypothetical protein